jgi:choline monooxygenase
LPDVKRPLPPDAFLREETYGETRLPVSLATTLIPDAYTSAEFFLLERERVFGTAWVAVCCTHEVAQPGDFLVADVAGRSMIVTRNAAGELRAFYNVCRHRGARICDPGRGHVDRFFRCPYHSWAYDLNGACLGTPLFEESGIAEEDRGIFDMADVRRFSKSEYGLIPVHVEAWGCLVFVSLADEPAPLVEQLGDLPDRLAGYRLDEWEVARTTTYEIDANYKLVGENFMEYYHLPWVHPSLVKVSPMKSHYRWQGRGMYTGMTTTPIAQNSDEGGWKGLPPVPDLPEDDAVSARFVWLFPNLAINVLPNHVFLMLARPTAAGHTSELTYLLTHPSSIEAAGPHAESDVDQLASFWDVVNREDVAIVERVQEGLSISAYTGGRMCYRFEEPLHRFQNMVIDRMLGIERVPDGDAVVQAPLLARDA